MEQTIKEALARREREEALLRFPAFSYEDALNLGLKIIELAKARRAAVAVDSTVNQTQVFHYAMPGTNRRNAMWIQRKENMVQTSQISSLHAGQYLASTGKDLWKDWRLDEADYAAIGGGFPIIVAGTGVVGAVACSGLPHEMDHQLLVDAICQILGVDLEAEM